MNDHNEDIRTKEEGNIIIMAEEMQIENIDEEVVIEKNEKRKKRPLYRFKSKMTSEIENEISSGNKLSSSTINFA